MKNTNTKYRSSKKTNNKKQRSKFESNLDPNDLIQKSVKAETKEVEFSPSWSYDTTALDSRLKVNIARKGYKYPTPIQEQTLSPGLAGRDVLGIASTGTGKTAAFLIPIIHQMLTNRKPTKALVVVPTRELAIQVEEEFKSLTTGMGLFSITLIGGRSTQQDALKLRKSVDLIVGTPGRLIDLHNQRSLRLDTIDKFILDEFDRMLDMGFLNDIRKILKALTQRKQTMFFSATLDSTQDSLIKEILSNPVKVAIEPTIKSSDRVDQELVRLKKGENKFERLLTMLNHDSFHKVLVFAETKRIVNQVSKQLTKDGVKSDMIHGNKSQNYRQNALRSFTEGKVKVLVATDVAARGLDVSDVSHVINYQMPRTMDSYIHRVGRTGRAGKTGQAFTFVD